MATDDLTTYLRETWPVEGVGPITQAQRGRIHEAAAHIEALEAQLAAREIALTDETFKYAQAVHQPLIDVELEDALKAAGIFTYGPEAERFELMFSAAMKVRRSLIEQEAVYVD